jgi:hypothetical protein
MITDFEPVMAALFAHLVSAATVEFTGDATASSADLANVSAFNGLFVGLPVFGAGVPNGATIAALDENTGTVTLSDPVTEAGTAVQFTTGFLTTGRRVKHWSQVSDQPALFLRRIGVTDEQDQQFETTTLECEAWIYCNAGEDPDLAPDEALTCLERLVRESFAPDADYGEPRFTIGGLAYWCRIEGRSDISPGDQGGQAIARLPIRVTLP